MECEHTGLKMTARGPSCNAQSDSWTVLDLHGITKSVDIGIGLSLVYLQKVNVEDSNNSAVTTAFN